MKKTSIFLTIISVCSVLLFTFACSMTKTENKPVENKATENKTNVTTNTSPNTATNNSSNSNANSNSSSSSSTTTAPKDISGNYTVEGINEGGAGNYKGSLTVTKRGEVYQFSWNTDTVFDGVGVQTDSAVAVAFAEGENGKGCGVVLYKINSDGSLEGKAGYWGENKGETEKATRTSGTDLVGEYDIKGKNPEGEEYTGKLSVKSEGSGFAFSWTGNNSFKGFGIKQGNFVAVGLGDKKCGFVSYDVTSDGTMNGKWGSSGTTSVGTETAKKK